MSTVADRWCDGGLGSEHECFNSHPVRLYGPLGVQRTYIGAADPTDPLVSPMRGDLSGLPQTLLFLTGARDAFLGGVSLFDQAMLRAGGGQR